MPTFRDGHCTMANSRYEHSRASAGICYLTAAVRSRPNLHIVTGRTVTRLIARGRQIIGVAARRPDGSEEILHAHETLLAAGALGTPALMMRSGIGPGAHLNALGISVLADRAGVGRTCRITPSFTSARC